MRSFDRWGMLGFLLLGSALLWGGCGDDDSDGGGGSLSDDCAAACQTATALSCPGDTGDCAAECVQEAKALPECSDEYQAVVACAAKQPQSNWECDEFEESDLKEGVCDAEGTAAASCILANLGGSGSGG